LTETFIEILNWPFLTKIWMEGNLGWILELAVISLFLLAVMISTLLIRRWKRKNPYKIFIRYILLFHYFVLIFGFFTLIFVANFSGLKKGFFIKPIYRLPENGKIIALTFDDSPDSQYTRKILDILSHYQIKATFFVLGQNVKQYPDIVIDIFKKGHDIGNHSYSHQYMGRMWFSSIEKDMKNVEIEFKKIGLDRPILFRPPHGSKSPILEWYLHNHGYRLITWNLSPKDWKTLKPEIILSRLFSFVEPGSIILLHDGPNAVAILPEFIETMHKKGYRFVKISDILGKISELHQLKLFSSY
jgi:peptidoglycan/xylan/chitin deacetylase (PgdA/CDA1 family)